jgi:phosphate transport system permease protein
MTTADVTAARPAATSLPRKRIRWGEQLVHLVLFIAAAISVLTTVGIVVSLVLPALDFFREVSPWDFLTGTQWSPLFLDAEFGVLPLVVGTLMISFWSSLVAFPLGLGVAIYLSEYAAPRATAFLKPILEILAAIPTVVLGYFALTFVTPLLVQDLLGVNIQFNALSAGVVMGVMIMPTIASISEDSMSAVPQGLREGAFGMGATKRQVATRVVFPAAISGIVASIVLGISRGIGETMIVLIAAGLKPNVGINPTEPFATVTAFMGATAKGDNPAGTIGYESIFASGLTLFVLTLIMNMIAIRFVRKYREVYD